VVLAQGGRGEPHHAEKHRGEDARATASSGMDQYTGQYMSWRECRDFHGQGLYPKIVKVTVRERRARKRATTVSKKVTCQLDPEWLIAKALSLEALINRANSVRAFRRAESNGLFRLLLVPERTNREIFFRDRCVCSHKRADWLTCGTARQVTRSYRPAVVHTAGRRGKNVVQRQQKRETPFRVLAQYFDSARESAGENCLSKGRRSSSRRGMRNAFANPVVPERP
jgi:hypothetical protein